MYINFFPNEYQLWFIICNIFMIEYLLTKLELGEDGNITTEDLSDIWSWIDLSSPHDWHVGRMSVG